MSTEQLCNHNELINADFRQKRLVNQRGITSVSTDDYSMQSVDMWGVGWYTDLTVHEDGLVIASNTNHSPGMILQKFEHPEDYINKMVTISAIIDGHIVSASGVCNPSTYYPATEYNGARIDITENGYRILTFNTNKVTAVMLEYGDTSTLHNWHGDYAAELLKCQRYVYILSGNATPYPAYLYNQINIVSTIYTTVPMRIIPTMVGNPFRVYVDGVERKIVNYNAGKRCGNAVQVWLELDAPITGVSEATSVICAVNNDGIATLLTAEL